MRSMRIELQMTSQELARLADVSPTTLSTLENGHRTDISLDVAQRICDTVGIEITLAFRGQAKPLPLPENIQQRVRRRS